MKFVRGTVLPDPNGDITLPVPEEFQQIGYSGLFWSLTPIKENENNDAPTKDSLMALADRVPFLSPNPGWMVLDVDIDQGVAILVRHDSAAFSETFRQ